MNSKMQWNCKCGYMNEGLVCTKCGNPPGPCASASKFPQFTCNPVFEGMFELGDTRNTKVEFSGAGELVHIIQGDQTIEVSIGFFRDVCIVFDRAMEQCKNEDQASAMLFYGLGSSRSYPVVDWD